VNQPVENHNFPKTEIRPDPFERVFLVEKHMGEVVFVVPAGEIDAFVVNMGHAVEAT